MKNIKNPFKYCMLLNTLSFIYQTRFIRKHFGHLIEIAVGS